MEKAELNPSIHYIATTLKSGIQIYNSKVPDTAGRKPRRRRMGRRRRRRTYAIAKRVAFHAEVLMS